MKQSAARRWNKMEGQGTQPSRPCRSEGAVATFDALASVTGLIRAANDAVFDAAAYPNHSPYPDGELLTYGYDSGGNVKSAQGKKANFTYDYLNRLTYDKFEQRAQLEAGNGITTRYNYDPRTRRLANLQSGQGAGLGNQFQNLSYGYDNVGNILSLTNTVPVPHNSYGGPVTQAFSYDALYRLTEASGNFQSSNQLHAYTLTMAYDSIHNLTSKQQAATVDARTDLKSSYTFPYAYEGSETGSEAKRGRES